MPDTQACPVPFLCLKWAKSLFHKYLFVPIVLSGKAPEWGVKTLHGLQKEKQNGPSKSKGW